MIPRVSVADCGCLATRRRRAGGEMQVEFCRLHRAAPELFDALCEIGAAVSEFLGGENQNFARLMAANDTAHAVIEKVTEGR
jgi:hypothetical protein